MFLTLMHPETAQTTVALPLWIDLAAVAAGAVSGVLEARQRKLDLMGYIALALVCALGGGLIRDVIMQTGSVYMLESPYAIAVCLIVGFGGFLFTGILLHIPRLIEWADIIAVGLFAAAGTDKALFYEQHALACLLMGVLTGVGGGMLRDTILGDVPRIFEKGNLYATCALGGALSYFLMVQINPAIRPWAVVVCVVITTAIRRASLRWNVSLPSDGDLTPQVARGVRKIVRVAKRPHKRIQRNDNSQ